MNPLPRRKAGKKKPALPSIPPGNELLDILWRDTARHAREVFTALPEDVPDEWATPAGIDMLDRTLLREVAAKHELAQTRTGSALWLTRHRAAQREVLLGYEQAQRIAAALVRGIRHDYPKAAPEQVWLVLRDRFRALVGAWLQTPEGIEATSLDGEANSS